MKPYRGYRAFHGLSVLQIVVRRFLHVMRDGVQMLDDSNRTRHGEMRCPRRFCVPQQALRFFLLRGVLNDLLAGFG